MTAQQLLADAGFPCPRPVCGPDQVDGLILSAETLLAHGGVPDGRDPAVRRLIAAGLARHVDLLRARPDLIADAGRGPAWCRYDDGPWPTPHDPIFDFATTPAGYAWLDDLAAAAAAQIAVHREGAEVIVGHADWYAGNLLVDAGELVASFDWDLTADTEAVIAGFSASCFAASATAGGGLSTPDEVVAFLRDYETARGRPFTRAEQRTAPAAAVWTLAYNARCELGLLDGPPPPGSSLDLLRNRDYDLHW